MRNQNYQIGEEALNTSTSQIKTTKTIKHISQKVQIFIKSIISYLISISMLSEVHESIIGKT